MPANLCFTIRLLQPYAHGRGDGGEPEWPPSPLRFFQALTAAAAGYWNERMQLAYAVPALAWLEKQAPPTVIAAAGVPFESRYRLYVPDNVGDKVARSWTRGGTEDIAGYRTEKDVRPTRLTGEAVHFLFAINDGDPEFARHGETLATAARAVTHLGWGIDMVVGDARILSDAEAGKLNGERWLPAQSAGDGFRVPIAGTLDNLMAKHQAFLNRLQRDARGNESFLPVPPVSAFRIINYRRANEPEDKPFVAFQILKPDLDGNRSFDTPLRCRDVAAWIRHAVGEVCEGWPYGSVAGFVHGHDADGQPTRGGKADQRFMFLPLPTINSALNRVESIRRVLIAAPAGFQSRIAWLRQRLAGQELVWKGEFNGVLNLLSKPDWVTRQYTDPATTWATVTPVVLPGHDDRSQTKAASLIQKALVQAGLPPELLKDFEFEFRKVGFLPGVDLADRYVLPEVPPVKGPRYHVWVRFPRHIPGPLAVGALRYRGFGLFARAEA